MQGDFAKLLQEEKESVTWQSFARKVHPNIMAFAARLSPNSLVSPDILKRWEEEIWALSLCVQHQTQHRLAYQYLHCSSEPGLVLSTAQ